MIKEADGGSFKFKPKSSVNKDSYVFIPSMMDKRICPWVAIDKWIEFNKLSLELLTASTSYTSFSSISPSLDSCFLFLNHN
jgi:hypothetical protein